MHYVVIHGHDSSLIGDRKADEYVSKIVYGDPTISAVKVGPNGKFVALCEYDEEAGVTARYTFERMGSFPHGAQYLRDLDIAHREFGVWIRYYVGQLARRVEELR